MTTTGFPLCHASRLCHGSDPVHNSAWTGSPPSLRVRKPMSTRTVKRTILGVAAAGVVGLALVNAAADGGEATARSKLVLMAPAAPGGGWDGFARESQQAIKSGGISNNVQVVNVPGAGGTIGLGQFAQMDGRSDML